MLQKKEYQAVVLAGGNGVRLDPLTEELPKALLPVANRPLLYYPLRYLCTQGLRDIVVIVTNKNHSAVSAYLEESAHEWLGASLQLHSVEHDAELGSLGALRSLVAQTQLVFADQVIVMSVDTICDVPLSDVLSVHRRSDASLTMVLKEERGGLVHDENALLYAGRISEAHRAVQNAANIAAEGKQQQASGKSQQQQQQDGKKGGKPGAEQGKASAAKKGADDAADDDEGKYENDKTKIYEYIALEPRTNRVAHYSTSGEEDKLRLSRGFLRRFPCINWTSHLLDSHFYVMSRWVLDLITYEQRRADIAANGIGGVGSVGGSSAGKRLGASSSPAEPVSPISGGGLNRVSSSLSAMDSLQEELFGDEALARAQANAAAAAQGASAAAAAASAASLLDDEYPLVVSKFTSVKHELIPYLVLRQLTRLDFDRRDREFPRRAMLDAMLNGQRIAHHYSSTDMPNTTNHNSNPNRLDLIKCFAYVVPHKSQAAVAAVTPSTSSSSSRQFCRRCQTLGDYVDVNRAVAQGEIPLFEIDQRIVGTSAQAAINPTQAVLSTARVTSPMSAGTPQSLAAPLPTGRARSASNANAPSLPLPALSSAIGAAAAGQQDVEQFKANIGPMCVIGRGLQVLGDRVTLKKSNLGSHVKIGRGTKISNSIIMDNVTLGENCVIQNSIVCSKCHVQAGTTLDGCKVGHGVDVEAGSYKGEVMRRDSDF